MATGVLPIFIGRATRGVEFFESAEKEYIAGIRLGTVTNTQDITGKVLETNPVSATREDVLAALQKCTETSSRCLPCIPPSRLAGKSCMNWRAEAPRIERQPRQVTIFELELMGGAGCDYTLRVPLLEGHLCAHALP